MRSGDYNSYTDGIAYNNSPAVPHSTVNMQRRTLLDEKDVPVPPRGPDVAVSKFYPFSICLVAFWIVLIAGELILLEKSVAAAPTRVALPWYYSNDGLPNVLFTIFAQGHTPITAMHLSRLAVSALQSPRSAPRTWLELFWVADKQWAGPVGILMAAMSIITKRMRVSPTILMFSITTLVALVTPLVLGRAYPIQAIDVGVNRTFAPNTLTPSKLAGIDAYAQLAVGSGAWATNLTVLDLFNTTTFTPVSNPDRTADAFDFFFAGDVQDMDVTLPGVRIQGGCHVFDNQTAVTPDSFPQLCEQELPLIGDMDSLIVAGQSLSLNVTFCTSGQFQQVLIPSNTSALFWFQNTNITGELRGELTGGIVRCDTNFTTGHASLLGRTQTYENFIEDDKIYVPTEAGEPLLDPLYATIWHLRDLGSDSATEAEQAEVFGMFGYTETGDNGELLYFAPSLQGFADGMWRGTTHMALATSVLSRTSDNTFLATAHVTVSARTRNTTFFVAALALLGVWLLAVLVMTATTWRPTVFGDSLNSYCAARLLAERLDLLGGGARGGMADNRRLLGKFEPVDDDL